MWEKLFQSADFLQKGMEAAWIRNAVLRHNLANVETPGFKGSDVAFEELLLEAMEDNSSKFVGRKSNDRHIDIGGRTTTAFEDVMPRVYQNEDTSMRMDGNNVDAEAENVKLAQNSLKYNTMLEKLNSELTRIKLAIAEGR